MYENMFKLNLKFPLDGDINFPFMDHGGVIAGMASIQRRCLGVIT